jgi:hypothetical protein
MSRSLAAIRLHAALQLCDTGVRLMRQNLRRAAPEAPEEEIDRRLREWLRERPLVSPGETALRIVAPETRGW